MVCGLDRSGSHPFHYYNRLVNSNILQQKNVVDCGYSYRVLYVFVHYFEVEPISEIIKFMV